MTLYQHNCTFIRILSFCLISNNIWCDLDWNWCFKTIFPARSAHFWMMDICWVWNMFKMSLCFTISWPGGHFCKNSKAVEKGSEWWPRKSNCKCKDKTVCFWKVMITWEMQCIEGLGGINAVCRASDRRRREEWQIKLCVLLCCSMIRCDVAL